MVLENYQRILGEIEKKVGQKHAVEIVAVTKFQPVEKIEAAIKAGVKSFGVNYAQDGEKLRAALGNPSGLNWHFIGHIQSRKVKYLTEYQIVQSLDRLEVATALAKRLAEEGKTIEVLIEVNVADEVQKSGVKLSEVQKFADSILNLKSLKLVGLMSMPPISADENKSRTYFKQVKKVFDELSTATKLKHLSLGTSSDYLLAIEEGATMVRLGTTLFGQRATS